MESDPPVGRPARGEVVETVTSATGSPSRFGRREFFVLAGRRGLQIGLAGVSLPALLAACSSDNGGALTGPTPTGTADLTEGKIVGDVLDYSLTGDWEGAFGSVTFRLHKGVFNGSDVFFIRTDASDEAFAMTESLVWVPKLTVLAAQGPAADAYLISGGTSDQATVLSTQPGRKDYTPAWRVHRASWTGTPRTLTSVADVKAAEAAGELTIEQTDAILNAPVVRWSGGEMPVDNERKVYLGPGQLLEKPDTRTMTVTFKQPRMLPGGSLHRHRYRARPDGRGHERRAFAQARRHHRCGATGRTNVFMNGIEGSGPMGFQASVFDSQAGTPEWSPYWDHMTYAWKEGEQPRILRDEASIHTARDGGELDEFPGTPDTGGETFVVNCPVPVLAPNSV